MIKWKSPYALIPRPRGIIDTVKKLKLLVDTDKTYKDDVTKVMKSCPLYDMSAYIKRDEVPCYGCMVENIDEIN